MQLHAQRSLQKPAFTHYKYHHISVFCVLRSHPLRYVRANCLALKLSYKWQDFWKMSWEKNVCVCVFLFYLQTVWNSSHSIMFWARYYKKCTNIFT